VDQRAYRGLRIRPRAVVSILDDRDHLGDRPTGLKPSPDLRRRRIEAVVVPVAEVDDNRFSVEDLTDDSRFIDRVALEIAHGSSVYSPNPINTQNDSGSRRACDRR